MRICTDKSGKLIEMQDSATEGTLIKNALASGYKEDEIEEREVTEKEWQKIWDALPRPEAKESPLAARVSSLENALVLKSVLTSDDIAVKKIAQEELKP